MIIMVIVSAKFLCALIFKHVERKGHWQCILILFILTFYHISVSEKYKVTIYFLFTPLNSTERLLPWFLECEIGTLRGAQNFWNSSHCREERETAFFGKLFSQVLTPEFLINVQHVYLILSDFSFLHALIRNYMFIYFQRFFLPTCLFPPTCLLM